MHTTANRIRELREQQGLKQYDIAAKLRVDQATVARWEKGDTSISDDRKHQLAELFGVTIAYLMGWEEIPA